MGNEKTSAKNSGSLALLGGSQQGFGHFLNTSCPRGKIYMQNILHLYKREEGEKRKVAKILDWVLGILRARANAATNSPVTLGKFLLLASISPGPQLP